MLSFASFDAEPLSFLWEGTKMAVRQWGYDLDFDPWPICPFKAWLVIRQVSSLRPLVIENWETGKAGAAPLGRS